MTDNAQSSNVLEENETVYGGIVALDMSAEDYIEQSAPKGWELRTTFARCGGKLRNAIVAEAQNPCADIVA